ncbi:hypothetical protein JM654_12080 [Microbacterium oxydans]|nr:hypothetical protein [Microbacterium oxydans]
MSSLAGRIAAGAVLAATVGVLAGCAPSIGTLMRDSLADSVEDAQDMLWEYRDQMIEDPEATVAGFDFIVDARGGADTGSHLYTPAGRRGGRGRRGPDARGGSRGGDRRRALVPAVDRRHVRRLRLP